MVNKKKQIHFSNFSIGQEMPMFCIAGPCVLEDYDTVMQTAKKIKEAVTKAGIYWIFKSSYLKDNRTNADTYMGPGIEEGLRLLECLRSEFDVPVLSDIHSIEEIEAAASVLDVLQIPAFLCQQTRLLLTAGKTGKPINIKKGQFLSPDMIRSPIGKIESTGNRNIMLTERGTCFGYNQLVVDMCSIAGMKQKGYPVIFDPTHAIRNYGHFSSSPEGGSPEYIFPLALSGIAAGADGLFIETHINPKKARCDAASMLPVNDLGNLLLKAKKIHGIISENTNSENIK